MTEKQSFDILEQLAGAYLAVDDLNKAIPQLRRDIDEGKMIAENAKSTYENAIKILDNALMQGEKIDKNVVEAIKKISTFLNKIETIQKDIESTVGNMPDIDELEEQLIYLTERVEEIDKQLDDRISVVESEIKRLKTIGIKIADSEDYDEEDIESEDSDEDSDEDEEEFYSLNELYRANEEYPLIVVSEGWYGDYCYAVDGIVDGKVYGINFKNGHLRPTSCRRRVEDANLAKYKIYDGPNKELIKEIVNGEGLADFWQNRGFKINDERSTGNNKYLFVMESDSVLKPWVELVKKLYNVNGHFYGDHWGTISSK